MDKLWDARNELNRMRAIVGALWYLSRPHRDDAGFEDLNETFGIIEAALAETAEMLSEAFDSLYAGE